MNRMLLSRSAGLLPWVAAVAMPGLLAGCLEDFDPQWLINKPRVLGARVMIEDRPEQAWPRPNEPFRLQWLVADSEPLSEYEWVFGACVAAPTLSGAGLCQSDVLALEGGSGREPFLDMVSPDEQALGEADTLLVAGVICGRGSLQLATGQEIEALENNSRVFSTIIDLVQCEGQNAERMLVSFNVTIQREEQGNIHPRFAVFEDPERASIVIDDDLPWMAADPSEADVGSCGPSQAWDSAMPTFARGDAPIDITLFFDPESTDSYSVDDEGDEQQEGDTLFDLFNLSLFTTSGELQRARAVTGNRNVRPATPPTASLSWTPPSMDDDALPSEPFKVAFYFVVRDLRGGLNYERRLMCIR